MKICIVCPYDYPIPAIKGGAIEQIIQDICILNEEKKCLDITVLTIEDKNAEKKYGEYKLSRFVPFRTSKYDALWYLVFRVIKKLFKINIPVWPRMIAVRKWLETNQNEYDYIIYEDGLTYNIPYLFKNVDTNKVISHLHWVGDPNKKTNRYISRLFAVSDYIGNLWREKNPDSSIKIDILKNGINIQKFDKDYALEQKNKLKESLGVTSSDVVLIYIGRIVPEKGVLELIKAVNKINNSSIKLLVLGGAKFGSKTLTAYERQVNSLIEYSDKKIIKLGYVANDELYKYQSIADFAIMPTLCEEAAPLTTVENLAAGLPIIITNSGGMPEYTDEKCTVMVEKSGDVVDELAKAICGLVSDRQKIEDMKKYTKLTASKFTLESTYNKLVALLDEQ